MAAAFLLLRPVKPVSGGPETPWLGSGAFTIDEGDWVDFLALIATDPAYADLVEALREFLPFREMSRHPVTDLDPGIISGIERWLTEIHLLTDLFDGELPAAEDYISFFALQQMLKSVLRVLRFVRSEGLDYEAGLSL